MGTVVKSIRIDEDTLVIIEKYNDLLNRAFHSDKKLNFSALVNGALISTFEGYSANLNDLADSKGYHHRNKAGQLTFTKIDESLIPEMKELANRAFEKYITYLYETSEEE